MKIVGIQLARNEADILRVNLRYHLALGLDGLLVTDNGSTDATPEILEEIARSAPVRWRRDERVFRSGEMLTDLARDARADGADWLAPIDVDEFWHIPAGDVRAVLKATSAGGLRIKVANFVQRRSGVPPGPEVLMTMDHRAVPAVPGFASNERATEAAEIAYVEIDQVPKTLPRASAHLEVGDGSHSLRGVEGMIEDTDQIVVLHGPLRRPAMLDQKAQTGLRIIQRGFEGSTSWHLRRWWRLLEERGSLEAEWLANSQERGHLDVDGSRHRVLPDDRLQAAVRPWIDPPGASKESARRLDELAVRTGEVARLRE